MGNAGFGIVFMVGTIVYGVSFLINGPLTDRFGGRFSILVGAFGALVVVYVGLAIWAMLLVQRSATPALAEALAGLVLTQLVRPGSPFVYGGFTSNVDMQSGAPAFGTPEYWKTAMVGGQLARRYGVPYRSSNACAANGVDAQAAYESMFSIWGAVSGRVNFLMHGAGWMEGGLQASFEKMVIDADLLHMASAALDPLVVDESTLAIDTIGDIDDARIRILSDGENQLHQARTNVNAFGNMPLLAVMPCGL